MRKAIPFEYDPEADAAYVRLCLRGTENGAAMRQVVVENASPDCEIVLDFDASGRLLGMEIIGAAACLPLDLLTDGKN